MMGGGSTPKTTKRLSPSVVERLHLPGTHGAALSLLVYHRDGAHVVQLRADASVTVGRSAPSDVTINDVSLSRQHARFTLKNGEVIVEDLGSTNGTFIGTQPVDKASLKPGDEVLLGVVTVTVHDHGKTSFSSGLTGHERFRSLVEDEVLRARFFGRPLTVMMVRAMEGDERHVRFWSPRVQPLLRPVDRAAIYGPEMLEILLPETSSEMAMELARKIVEADRRLGCGLATYPDAGTSSEEMLGESRAAAQKASAAKPVQAAMGQGTRTVRPPPGGDTSQPIAVSTPMAELLQTASRVAKGAIPVLINGETGTGKEVLSRFIHDRSLRKDEPIICVNCGAISPQLVESTLFGHEKGAFTGAAQQQKGVFEAANGGTVFLDEIGELPAAAQAALLRVLESKRFTRVGSTRELNVDVRVIAATHRDLEAMCEDGSFRRDLYYRLNTITLKVPPLRERSEDIEALSYRLLEGANEANAGQIRHIDHEALSLMRSYDWPGNVRELKNAIERAVVIAEGDTITADDLPEAVRARRPEQDVAAPDPRATLPAISSIDLLDGDFRSRMERLEAEVLTDALRRVGWNQTEASRRLAMPLRTLVYKIRMHGIRKPPHESGAAET